MITADVRKYIEKTVLCWLATCNKQHEPNVSPKEMFTAVGDSTLLIAHLASPNSIQNIRENQHVCVSFVDVFVQKGYKLKGTATIVDRNDPAFSETVKPLLDLFGNDFPIKAVIVIQVKKVETIQAPSYFLFPNTTEESQVLAAMKTYKVRPE